MIALFSSVIFAATMTMCPQQTSIFGTVVDSHPDEVTIHTIESAMGDIHVLTKGARVHANGLTPQPGVYVGVYGCLNPGDRSFRAQELTYSTNANSYNGYRRRASVVTGRVDTVQTGRVLVDSNNGHGDLWVYTTRTDLRNGELVRATGTFDPRNSAFVASTVVIERP